jgi:hypothetical protein
MQSTDAQLAIRAHILSVGEKGVITEREQRPAKRVPLEQWRAEVSGRPTVVALPVTRPYGDWGKIVDGVPRRARHPAIRSPQACSAMKTFRCIGWVEHRVEHF